MPEGPTILSLTRTMERLDGRDYGFTLELTNRGENAALNVTISDFGPEIVMRELQAGRAVQLD